MRTNLLEKAAKMNPDVVQKNDNNLLVNVNLGVRKKKQSAKKYGKKICGKKKCQRIWRNKAKIRKRVHAIIRHVICTQGREIAVSSGFKETICIRFKLRNSGTKHLIWRAVGVAPTGNLLIHNKSNEKATFLIKRVSGEEEILFAEPKSEVSLTITDIVQITSCCANAHYGEDRICFGLLTLNLQSTCVPIAKPKGSKVGDLAVKNSAMPPIEPSWSLDRTNESLPEVS